MALPKNEKSLSLAAYNEGLKIRQEIGAKKEAGDTLIDLGDLYLERGDSNKALQMFKESLQIQRDAGDQINQALCLSNIGAAYLQKTENEDALTYLQQALQIREKLNVPVDIAQTLHNLGEAYANLGQYDQAMTSYTRGLDLYRKADEKQGIGAISNSMGLVFEEQGHLGPAGGALEDAVKAFRDLGDRSGAMAQSLTDLAGALAMVGRGQESTKLVEEAQGLGRSLNSNIFTTSLMNTEGDIHFYQGDWKSAKDSYQQAQRLASRTSDQDMLLISKLNLAKIAVSEGHSKSTAGDLRTLAQRADSLGKKYISVVASTLMAQALIETKDYTHARQELQRNLSKSEKLGLRLQNAKIHFLIGSVLRLSGTTSEATPQFREALRLLDEIRKEPGAEDIIQRYDLKPIYAETTELAKTS